MKIKDWSNRLVAATVLITVVRYMGAFAIADAGSITGWASEALTVALTLSGLGMGILDTVGGGLLFNGWRLAMPRSGDRWSFRFKVLTVCVFGLIVSGLVILVPFTVARAAHVTIVEALGGTASPYLLAWALMVNMIPYLLIAGVFVGNRMVEGLEQAPASSGKLPQVAASKPKTWRQLTASERQEVKAMSANQIQVAYQLPERTARKWKEYTEEL